LSSCCGTRTMNAPPCVIRCTGGLVPAASCRSVSALVGRYTSAATSPCLVGIEIRSGRAIGLAANRTAGEEYCRRKASGNRAWNMRADRAARASMSGSLRNIRFLLGTIG